MNNEEFIAEVFEIAFGADAFPDEGADSVMRGYSREECINRLKGVFDAAWNYEELCK